MSSQNRPAMKAILNNLVVVACVAMASAGVSEFYETYSPVEPYIPRTPAKLIKPDTKIDVKMGDEKFIDEIRFYPENPPTPETCCPPNNCKGRFGIELTQTGSVFCNLNYISFKIEDMDLYLNIDYFDFPEDFKFFRETKTIITANLVFESEVGKDLKMTAPIFQIPSRLAKPRRSRDLLQWAQDYELGFFAPVDETKLGQINDEKKFQLEFEWLSNLFSAGVYPGEASDTPIEGKLLYFTRPVILQKPLINQFESVINKYTKGRV